MKILIRSARDSFRRAGLTFTRAGVIVDADDLTEEQREAITDEPQLSVGPVPDEKDDADADAKAAAAAAKAKAAIKSSKKAK